ncbi:MAG: oligosaccharide flippase family protein [Actinomycetota bacterium]|nr:oligosaccharide flippase family protein [Actinomycetota bacterium]
MIADNGHRRQGYLSKEAAADVGVLARGGSLQIIGQFTQGAIAFVFVAIAVRLLGTAQYGVYRQVAQILSIAAQIGLAGFNYAALRYIAKARAIGDHGGVRGTARTAIGATLVASGLVFSGLIIAAHRIATRFATAPHAVNQLAALLRIGAAFVPLFALTQVLRYCTQAYKTMRPSVIVGNIVQPGTRFVVGIALLVAGFAVTGMVVALVVSAAVAVIAGTFYYVTILSPEERLAVPRASVGSMTRFALLQGGASVLGVQTLGLSILILGVFSSNREVGLFAIGLALQTPGTIFLGGIINIWAPVVTDLYERGEIARLESLYQAVTRWIITFSFPVFAALIFTPQPLVRLFAGGAGAGAAGVVAVLAIGNAFYAGTGPTGFVISMTGKPGINFINSAIAVALYVGVGVWAAPRYGAIGVAWVDAAVTAVINVARVAEARILVGIHPFGRSLLKPVAATAVMAIILAGGRIVGGSQPLIQAGGLILGAVAYVLVLQRLGMSQEEMYVWQRLRSRVAAVRRRGPRT